MESDCQGILFVVLDALEALATDLQVGAFAGISNQGIGEDQRDRGYMGIKCDW